MFLSADELFDLTGYSYPSKQVEWLKARRFVFEIGGDGRPKVLREYVTLRLGGARPVEKPEPKLHLI